MEVDVFGKKKPIHYPKTDVISLKTNPFDPCRQRQHNAYLKHFDTDHWNGYKIPLIYERVIKALVH